MRFSIYDRPSINLLSIDRIIVAYIRASQFRQELVVATHPVLAQALGEPCAPLRNTYGSP